MLHLDGNYVRLHGHLHESAMGAQVTWDTYVQLLQFKFTAVAITCNATVNQHGVLRHYTDKKLIIIILKSAFRMSI